MKLGMIALLAASIDRSRYVYEGPNGTPRGRRDYSPNERLRTQPFAGIAADPDDTAATAANRERRQEQRSRRRQRAKLRKRRGW